MYAAPALTPYAPSPAQQKYQLRYAVGSLHSSVLFQLSCGVHFASLGLMLLRFARQEQSPTHPQLTSLTPSHPGSRVFSALSLEPRYPRAFYCVIGSNALPRDSAAVRKSFCSLQTFQMVLP